MAYFYEITSTSNQSADGPCKSIQENEYTRKVIYPKIVENTNFPERYVKITLGHQRKNRSDQWEKVPTESLAKLKAGEVAHICDLDTTGTRELYQELRRLYEVGKDGVISGTRRLVVIELDGEVNEEKAKSIGTIASSYPNEIWEALAENESELLTKLSYGRIQYERKKALDEFEQHMNDSDWKEDSWQDFFERNHWIFGYGLKYIFTSSYQREAAVGGQGLTGAGTQIVDFLDKTEGLAKFTVIVEIKTPQTRLLKPADKPYRNGAWLLSEDLTGGVSQTQANCNKWNTSGARQYVQTRRDARENIHTIQPKGALVIGNLQELEELELDDKLSTFELYRNNLFQPSIITFDELYERAKYIVESTGSQTDLREGG